MAEGIAAGILSQGRWLPRPCLAFRHDPLATMPRGTGPPTGCIRLRRCVGLNRIRCWLKCATGPSGWRWHGHGGGAGAGQPLVAGAGIRSREGLVTPDRQEPKRKVPTRAIPVPVRWDKTEGVFSSWRLDRAPMESIQPLTSEQDSKQRHGLEAKPHVSARAPGCPVEEHWTSSEASKGRCPASGSKCHRK